MTFKRRRPAPVRTHRKRGLGLGPAPAPAQAPSPAIADAMRRLELARQGALSGLRLERARALEDEPGEALQALAELWKTTYADR
ncbi:hypothetical protein [Caulobacter endophyticus]|uniref:hypothetical protein n=1 Tax=Caulobacter endophyticus TaxID=2172652 RepID=UPI00240F356E|nr:hypothetical protein [Caulobacter endophyticus]MDG2530676.1 hypothetical protein [Caulobacter endophyticus]